ncbi:hypothetical protein [Salinicola endophyticus]|uniref:Pesticidal crystal protein N-terminal domain-containing protein n=1 Tax=Salinicola endophyticus TaxID=1949083 RepID=A0AB74UCH4_9GAMM
MEQVWSSLIQAEVTSVTSKLPYIGTAVSSLVRSFWPSNRPSIWDQIRDQVSEMVDQKILAFELQEREGDIDGIKTTLHNYCDAKTHEKGMLLSAVLAQCNTLSSHLRGSKNSVQLTPLIVTSASIHLTVLSERLYHGEILYNEDNVDVWEKELTEMYECYAVFLSDAYSKWKEWRFDQITCKYYTTKYPIPIPPFFSWETHGEVLDALTNKKISRSEKLNGSETYYKESVEAIKRLWGNSANASMIISVAPSFLFHKYIPERAKENAVVPDGMRSFIMGPYSATTLGLAIPSFCNTDTDDLNGDVTQFLVREYNTIDALQFVYGDRKGNLIGNSEGGEIHIIETPGGAYPVGMKMRFIPNILCSVNIKFSDNSESGELGNRFNRSGCVADATVQNGFKLVGGSFRKGVGPSSTTGPGVIQLSFEYSQ